MTNIKGSAHMPVRALVVCAPFFSYHLAIRKALEDLGWEVTWWSDRASDRPAYKFAMRLAPSIVAHFSRGYFRRKLAELQTNGLEHVLVVKGEAVPAEVVRTLREMLPKARVHLYLWDASANASNGRRIAALFDTVSTFDPVDAGRFGWRHRPLFASVQVSRGAVREAVEPLYDWAFVGTLHSDRHRVISRVRCNNPDLRGFVRAFVPGKALLLGRRLTDLSLLSAPPGTVSTTPMPMADVLRVMDRSRSILDIEHPRQRGLTMRTIESLLNGRKLVTTNAYIQDSDLYHPSRVQVISRKRPEIPRAFLDEPFEPVAERLVAKYALSGWAREVLELGVAERAEMAG